jgi:Tol biopolymer transport system component
MRGCRHALSSVVLSMVASLTAQTAGGAESPEGSQVAGNEARLLSHTRQLIFEGRRSGEGYFSADGAWMIFQSEREPGNPFYQMYLMDLETGDTRRLSPGYGKTTCGWIHPDGDRVMFASSHEDPEARAKQAEELDKRAKGQGSRYAWSFDEHYDIYQADLEGAALTNLTRSPGYDAEGSWSPDGRLIAFASNRHAYTEALSKEEQKAFGHDKSYFMEIYLMNADGSGVRRLTHSPGYDGGPFFSPDGGRIVWRRFTVDGTKAEVWTMKVDGSDQRQITRLGVLSWAPYYHPSGDYIIFTTNRHGYGNFELYMVDSQGLGEPVRVTETPGFDGLPVFSPDGGRLAWASSRTADHKPQIFIADWDDAEARRLLGLDEAGRTAGAAAAPPAPDLSDTAAQIRPEDLRLHVSYLADKALGGRLTGTAGERLATAYVARVFESLGLEPAGVDGSYFQPYEFTAGVSLGEGNRLVLRDANGSHAHPVDQEWRPLAFSGQGPVEAGEVVFAGYGIVAPASDRFPAYDAYTGLDVKGRWVMVLRYMPEDISPEHRQHLSNYTGLRYKAMLARDKGARGLIVVSGPNAQVQEQLVKLTFDAALAGTSMAAISANDALADALLAGSGRSLKALQDALDGGEPVPGFVLPGVTLEAVVDLHQEHRTSRNVLARLPAKEGKAAPMLVVGAHVDHIGNGVGLGSLADKDEQGMVHPGADDNASGVAGMLEIAQYLADQQARGRLGLKRDVLFAAWTGEELGLLGSGHFVKQLTGSGRPELSEQVAAYLNLDMIGRLDKKLYLQGMGSSSVWAGEVERRNVPVGLPVLPQKDSYLPTDATSFYLEGVPVLSAFTGAHADYNTPRDTAERVNYEGAARVARLMGLLARGVATADASPDYIAMEKPAATASRANLRAYLGTIPEYGEIDITGVKLNGVAKGGPADKGGLRAGDIIVALAGRRIENIYDYTYALNAVKVGQPVVITVQRDGRALKLEVIPGSRE